MEEQKKSKKTFKESWHEFWENHGETVKFGLKCLGGGLLVGGCYGYLKSESNHMEERKELIKKIPYEPDDHDIYSYVVNHRDDPAFRRWIEDHDNVLNEEYEDYGVEEE